MQLEKGIKNSAQWIAVGVVALIVGGVALAANGFAFQDCNNCTVNVQAPQSMEVPVGPPERLGSVNISNEYHATTTGFSTVLQDVTDLVISTNTAWVWNSDENSVRRGSLGSVILTGPKAGTGVLEFYDATTTNVLKRALYMTTSSLLITSIPTNNTTGTYVFDTMYQYGLIAVIRGTMPTSTITWR